MTWNLDRPVNDVNTIRTYAPGSPEREKLLDELARLRKGPIEIPLVIGGQEIRTGDLAEVRAPDDHGDLLARTSLAGEAELRRAVDDVLAGHAAWAAKDWYDRVAVFWRAAALLSGPRRTRHIAAIMLNHSKNPYEAEIDLAELVDFWTFNAYYARQIYEMQPFQYPGETNRFDWRPLEGFVLAIPPFNFYSIAGNLPTAPALVGNVALWKPARSVALSNYLIYQVLVEAGLPPSVIDFVPFPSKVASVVLDRPELEAAQQANDVMLAHRVLKAAFVTDVSPILAEARRRGGGAIDPIAVYRASKYRAHKAKERPAVAGLSSGIV